MEKRVESKIIVIKYECDVYGNHDCATDALSDTRESLFTDKMDAIHFIGECTSCKHDLQDIHPELFYWENNEEHTLISNKELEEYRINNNF
tara:strand:- start:1735 stop:2007 length:273 start_codon:yes stop_codon:yes gene_type:complete